MYERIERELSSGFLLLLALCLGLLGVEGMRTVARWNTSLGRYGKHA